MRYKIYTTVWAKGSDLPDEATFVFAGETRTSSIRKFRRMQAKDLKVSKEDGSRIDVPITDMLCYVIYGGPDFAMQTIMLVDDIYGPVYVHPPLHKHLSPAELQALHGDV